MGLRRPGLKQQDATGGRTLRLGAVGGLPENCLAPERAAAGQLAAAANLHSGQHRRWRHQVRRNPGRRPSAGADGLETATSGAARLDGYS